MNAESDIRTALLSLLRGNAVLMAQVNRVYDGTPVKATPPMVVLGDCIGTDWGCKDRAGRELAIGLVAEDDAETTNRISGIMPLVDSVVQQVSGVVSGWQIASLRSVRSRLLRTNAGRWNAVMDYRMRVLRAG